jgi:hypothetical protein
MSRIPPSACADAQDCSESDQTDEHTHENDQPPAAPPQLGSVAALPALRHDALLNSRIRHVATQV